MYKSKYLPVEGEIKEDGWYFSSEGKLSQFSGRYALGDKLPEAVKPVKLFLISDDIQVGDTLKVPKSDFEGKVKLKFNHKDYGKVFNTDVFKGIEESLSDKKCVMFDTPSEPWFFEEDCYKVLGEIITPGIKEGQIFTEKEIEYLTIK